MCYLGFRLKPTIDNGIPLVKDLGDFHFLDARLRANANLRVKFAAIMHPPNFGIP